ncbi:MAG: glutaredoxin 3 [Parvularculaceae bacterium]|nr:glutaredoxin 3 [Parvularculaceae bacterium]
MKPIEIYTKDFCPYCERAKALLGRKNASYTEIPAAFDPPKKAEMIQRSKGRSTFPQIFIDGVHVGGCDDLLALEAAGKLDALLHD